MTNQNGTNPNNLAVKYNVNFYCSPKNVPTTPQK